jgi:hypothetical protein
MFHPAWFGIDLLVFLLIYSANGASMIKEDAACAGGALVYGGDEFWHLIIPWL